MGSMDVVDVGGAVVAADTAGAADVSRTLGIADNAGVVDIFGGAMGIVGVASTIIIY